MEFFKLLIGCVFISTLSESASALECHTCMTQPYIPYPGAPTPGPGANNCDDPFNMEGIAKDTCMGKCFANLTSVITPLFNTTISQRGCLPADEPCIQGCFSNSGPGDQGLPPGASASLCNYCCENNLCNGMPIAETARQQAPPTVMPAEGSRMCWKCEQAKSDATAGSCASDDFNGEGATKVDCNAHCVSLKRPNEQGVDAVYRDCDPSPGALFCQTPGAVCCTEELCNGEGGEEGGAPAVASSSAAIFVGTLFAILAFM